MEYNGAVGARKHVRGVFVTADAAESRRWAAAIAAEHSLDVRYAASLAEALAAIATQHPDVAIAAPALGDGSYRDLLRSLHAAGTELPVVLVGELDRDALRDAFALGAIDVVASGDLARIGAAVARALREGVVGALLRRTRAAATLLEETLRRTSGDLAVVALDERPATIVYATRSDLVGRPMIELPFVRDEDEAEELMHAVERRSSVRLAVAEGTLIVEPFSAPPGNRRYAAISCEREPHASESDRDPLTGLPGRTAFELRAARAMADAERDGNAVAVLFLDVDRFRIVNELGGHAAGDEVLRSIAQRLRFASPHAFASRFGGDEFVLLCAEDGPDAARATADAAVGAFREPFVVDGKPVYLTPSIGVASAPEDASDVGALIGTAEAAVFEAKRLGRNMVRWYAASGATSTFERVLTRRDLQGAIERGEFELYYQPMYDVATRAIEGLEALIRWRRPQHGLVLPDRFIPVAEECGLIEALGAWVLETAIAQVRTWTNAGIPAVRVSVNVSARQFESRALPGLVGELLERYGVAASSLEIEVTESAIMRDVGIAAALLGELRALGVRVSIDDFGTGYTSLGFLKRFPVDTLKIDRSFVADVAAGAFDGAVVRAVTTLARGLGVRTVAEGVEAEEQFERLRALDCDVVQGFLFSRPVPAAACTPLLRTKLSA
ncbi:MAG TPA: bifunctional diguanylate cyclase/phosphodiesterase [Candidatus Limnocylindria bacterium]|nr:bifunctional diguanylate cyclase/phosphodiesterase [Candidatus Limnocylindria bacterium]